LGDATNNGKLTFAGAGTLTGNRQITIASNVDYTGAIGEDIAGRSLTKSGSATLTLSGTNTYTGATTIDAGTLALGTGGSISTSTTIDVKGSATLDVSALAGWALANGQTLKGNGTVEAGGTGNVVTISNGAFLAPGASPGTLLVNGDLSLASGSTFDAEIQTSGSPTGDLVNVNGNLSIISGALLDLGLFNTDTTLANGSKYSLFSYSGSWNSGIFTGYADDSDFTFGLNQFRINYNDLSGGVNGGAYSNYVTLTVVPEPRAALLAGIGMLALLRRRRPQAVR
jgi:autotransporter-associated beta strand protein